jgi:hypothetical protein
MTRAVSRPVAGLGAAFATGDDRPFDRPLQVGYVPQAMRKIPTTKWEAEDHLEGIEDRAAYIEAALLDDQAKGKDPGKVRIVLE